MSRLLKSLTKYEKWFFLLIVLVNLLPVFSYRFFPTLDGPAHLYNANLINHLLFTSHSNFDSFLQFNSEAVPNWTGHALLCFFKWFLPGSLAEKMVFILYFVGLPYSFRNLTKSINPEYIGLSYLIFPFTYNYLLALGFYNFSFGLIGLLLILSYWIKNHQTIAGSIKKILILSLLLILTYFSHIVMFSIGLLALSCYTFITFLKQFFETKSIREAFISHFKKALILLISSSIPLVLMILYFTNRPDSGNAVFLPKDELIKWMNYLNPVICYNEEVEMAFTRKVIYILYALIIGGIIVRIRNRKSVVGINEKSGIFRLNDLWLLITGIMLLLLFVMPDENGMASIISMRFGLLFFLFLVIWISSMKQVKWFVFVCSALILIVHFKRVHYLDSIVEIHNKVAINCNKAERFIKPNSVVAPINLTNNWFVAHFSNYLGIDKPMVILENYEASMDYFPLRWKTENLPNFEIGGESIATDSLFSSVPTNLKNEKKEVDYIFVLGEWDSLNADHNNTLRMISGSFVQTYKNENCTLYRRKKLRN
jgi:hypothetical protein